MSDADRGLLLDYGGVLTTPVGASFAAWEQARGLAPGRVLELVLAAYDERDGGLIGALERGEIDDEAFDARLVELLAHDGWTVEPGTVLEGLFAGMRPAGTLWDLAGQVRATGVPTGLLSNSWGTGLYPVDRLRATFDTLVISAEVGLRKPDPAIFELAAEWLGVAPQGCVFVDDLAHNVRAAERVGMRGVLHTGDEDATRRQVLGHLGLEPARS